MSYRSVHIVHQTGPAQTPTVQRLLSLTLAVLALSTGCAVPTPDLASESGDVPVRAHFAAATTTPHAVLEAVRHDWARDFGDSELAAIVAEAVERNWMLIGAQERVEQASLLAARAGATLGPIVDGVASAVRSDTGRDDRARTTLGLGVSGSWELDVWGRVRAAQRGAGADAAAEEEDYRALREAIGAQAAQAWILLVVARQQILLDEDLLAVRTRTLRVTEARAKAGVVVPIDVGIARADVNDAEALLRSSRQALSDAGRALEILLGRYPSAEISTTGELPSPPAQVPVGLPSDLLERRPDVRAADRRVAAAFYRTAEARAARLPRLALTGEYGTASSELRDVLRADNIAWSIGSNLLAPLIDGGQRRIDVSIAESRQREALAGYVDVALRAFSEVETALSAEQSFAEQQRALERAVDELARAREAAELRYERGLLSIFDLTQVEARLFAARRNLISVRGARVAQRVELHRALGGSFKTTDGRLGRQGETP